MKTVMAFLRIKMMNKTKKALSAAGITSMTGYGHCHGRGRGYWDAKVMEGIKNNEPEALALIGGEPRLRPQTMIMVTVPKEKAKLVVQTIMDTNNAGSHGDGKIFVLPEYDVIRVRDEASGDSILD
ncbi:MAG: P-II family nitrogen regulator [Prolixibacteraceae bacterium]|jgi:nitrogen regulatory protein PII 2|nr:P-II family nitrogen regulator [Prolixibacteraceae bacterium]